MLKRKLRRNLPGENDSDGDSSGATNKKGKLEDGGGGGGGTGSLDLSYSNCSDTDRSRYFPHHQSARDDSVQEAADETDDTNGESMEREEDADIEETMLSLQATLNDALRSLNFRNPVTYVYNPLDYASKCNEAYVRKYCTSAKKLLFVGMNPGPFGMCQTGVPFGEVKAVRDWLGIEREVDKPTVECPSRPVQGFQCPRTEVSGDRLWSLFREVCGTPEKFFANAFVYNYCPLAFMKADGCNVTPSELKNAQELEQVCDSSYLEIIKLLKPEIIICIGRYVEARTKSVLQNSTVDVKLLYMTHPSPRAINNQNWPDKAKEFLVEKDLMKYLL